MTAVAVLYAAKSTEDKHGSIPDQLVDGRKLAVDRGFEVVAELQDESASAYHGDRGPGLAKAMAECERLSAEHGTCALVVQHSDRLARGDAKQARHLIEVVLWAIKSDVQLLSAQDPEMLAGGDMALLLGAIGGMRNHQDSKRKGLAVKGGIRRRAVERGQFVGGRRPYGYRQRDTTDEGRGSGPLVVDQAEAAIVRRIFGEFIAGHAKNEIANSLMRDGVPTLTPGGSWYATTVAGMLRNEHYIGRVNHDGESHPGEHEPIIDAETWDQASQLREASVSRGRPRGRRTAGRHLLTEGLLRCTCGAAMSPVTKKDKRAADGEGYETYVCVKRLHHGPEACSQQPIKRDVIDGSVCSYFERVVLDEDATRAAMKEFATRERSQVDARQREAESELARAEARLDRITRGWQDGVIDDAEYVRQREAVADEREAAKAAAEQLERKREQVEAAMGAFDIEEALATELTALRQLIAGQVQEGSQSGLQSFRSVLKRVFVGFELASPAARFGSGVLSGQPWADDGSGGSLQAGDGYWLIPYIQARAVDLAGGDGVGFPGVQRAALALHDNLCTFLLAW